MTQALYRKWRPMSWDEVTGQDHVIQTLRNAVRTERIAHAYLFAGPRGTGKTTCARLLAKAANCVAEALEDRPCNECQHCRAVNDGRFLDLIEIDAASNTSVEDVRDLRDRINFSPNEGRYKVYIIDEVHMLSTAAFNALLKTLEEPPPHAIFVLATTEVHKIPATVLSRCQRHEFRRLPVQTIIRYLEPRLTAEAIDIEPEALELIARQATGSLRDAISLLDQLASTGDRIGLAMAQTVLGTAASEAIRGVSRALVAGEASNGLTLISRAMDGGADPRQFARQMVDYLRGLLLIQMGNRELVDATEDTRLEMEQLASSIDTPALLAAMRHFSTAAAPQRATVQSSLPLELAFVESLPVAKPARLEPLSREAEKPEGKKQVPPPAPKQQALKSAPSTPPEQQAPKSAPPAPPEQQAPEPASPPPPRQEASRTSSDTDGAALSFQVISARWRDVLTAARRHDPRVQALLNSCRPLGLEADAVVVGFGSDLLREKMEKGHNLSVAKQALEETFDHPLVLRCVLTGAWSPGEQLDQAPPPMEDGGMVSTALRDLGAHVVDVDRLPPEGRRT
jgi:DNA polymerase-3 subunit gamma/tau